MTPKEYNRKKKEEYELLEGKLLIEILQPSHNSLSKIIKLLATKIDPNEAFIYGNNALHHAAKLGKRRVLELLKQAGGDVLRTNESGQTALMIASRGTKRSHSLCVEYLLEENNCNVNAIDHEGRTALRQAILAGNAKTVELLLNYGSLLSWDELRIRCSNEIPQPMALKLTVKLNERSAYFNKLIPERVKLVLNPYDKIEVLLQSKIEEENNSYISEKSDISE